jgi:hypothetical protein
MVQISPSILNAQPDNPQDRDIFLLEYKKQQLYSFSLGLAASLLSAAAPPLAFTQHPATAMACAVSAVCIGAFWYVRPDDPKNLAQKAFRALEKKCEYETCPCDVEKPAGNYVCQCTDESSVLSILKQGADLDYLHSSAENLLEYASRQGYLGVVKYLVGLGFTLEKTRALSIASFVSTVEFLAEKGVPLDAALEYQFMRLVKAVKAHLDKGKQGRWPLIHEASCIIRLLRNRGITREPQLAPHYVNLFNQWATYNFTPDSRLYTFLKIYEDWSETVKSERKSPPFFIPTALTQGGIDPFNFHASNRTEFISNYRRQKAISLGLAFTIVSLVSSIIFLSLKKQPLQAIISAAAAVCAYAIWHFRLNDPKNLALEAFRLLKEGQFECTDLLKKGADLDVRFSFDPQLPSDNLLEYASRQGDEQTVQYLVGIGFNLADSRALHVAAYPNIVKFLAKKGVPVDPVGNEQSPLTSHVLRLLEAARNSLDSKKEKFPDFEFERQTIAFLLEKGAKKISDEYHQFLQKITVSISSPEQVRGICIRFLTAAPADLQSRP